MTPRCRGERHQRKRPDRVSAGSTPADDDAATPEADHAQVFHPRAAKVRGAIPGFPPTLCSICTIAI